MEKGPIVKLVSFTTPVDELKEEFNINDVQELVAFCARVSNPANQGNNLTSEKLILYLKEKGHWSPFEMVNVCLEVNTTRDIGRQLLRHRSFSFQEFSQRYARGDELGFTLREARLQDKKNRQNSIETTDEALEQEWKARQYAVLRVVQDAYNWAIDNGIAKENARAVLPEGLTNSRLYVNGTLRSWIHYLAVRQDKTTQKEHREIALACGEVLSKVFPAINKTQSTNS